MLLSSFTFLPQVLSRFRKTAGSANLSLTLSQSRRFRRGSTGSAEGLSFAECQTIYREFGVRHSQRPLSDATCFLNFRPKTCNASRPLSCRNVSGKASVREGAPFEGFYVVDEGAISVHRVNASGKMQVIHVFRAGESFAEAALVGTP